MRGESLRTFSEKNIKMTIRKTLKNIAYAGLASVVLATTGCSQNVSIKKLDEIRAEAEPDVKVLKGKAISSEYTQASEGAINRLSVIISNQEGYTLCYTEGTKDDKEKKMYNLASTIVKSAIAEKTPISITGNKKPEYFQIKSIEANGYRIGFDEEAN